MWDWNEAGLFNMQEKNCMAILIRGGEDLRSYIHKSNTEGYFVVHG